MQDDYNRFIKRSIKQAQCNYEDIFAADECACAGTMPDMDDNNSCGCMNVMDDTDMTESCGCCGVMSDMNNHCDCEKTCQPMCDKNIPVMAFVEIQPFGRMYNEAEGLCRGTLFPALDKPFTGRGGNCR